MGRRVAAAALAGLCALLVEPAPAFTQTGASSASCRRYDAPPNAAIAGSDQSDLQRFLGLTVAEQCLHGAETPHTALARFTTTRALLEEPAPIEGAERVCRMEDVSSELFCFDPASMTWIRMSDLPPTPATPVSAEETAFNRVRERNNTCEGWEAYIEVFGSTGAFGRLAAQERERLCTPPPAPPPEPLPAQTPEPSPPLAVPSIPLPDMVRIPGHNFEAGRFEVTFAEWDACVAGGGCSGYRPDDEGWGRGRRPVINVSWNDAQAYVQWLSGRTGRQYRLLTEQEWEVAARAGTPTWYSWGDASPVCDQNARNGANFTECTDNRTRPVGSFQPNGFGLYDVHGNVWEWVQDGDGSLRVRRGGSWGRSPGALRSADRNWLDPSIRSSGSGFRLARDLEG